MHTRSLHRRLGTTAALALTIVVASCGSGGADVDDAAPATNERPPTATPSFAAPPSTIATAPRAEGPNIGTWISIDRTTPTRERSYSELLYAAPFTEPVSIYKTAPRTNARSTFVNGLSVAGDGRTAFFGERTADLTVTPNQCTERLLSVDLHGVTHEIAKGTNPTIGPDASRIAFTSANNGACDPTSLHVRDLITGQQRDFDLSDFVGLLTHQTDVRFARISRTTWSPDGRRLAVSFGTPEDWHAIGLVDTQDWSLRLVRPDGELARRLSTVFGARSDIEELSATEIAWTANGLLALKIGCFACPPYEYALVRSDDVATVATEPTLPGGVKPAASVWLGTFEGWTLATEMLQVVAKSDTKRVVLIEADGFVLNASWPETARGLPGVPP